MKYPLLIVAAFVAATASADVETDILDAVTAMDRINTCMLSVVDDLTPANQNEIVRTVSRCMARQYRTLCGNLDTLVEALRAEARTTGLTAEQFQGLESFRSAARTCRLILPELRKETSAAVIRAGQHHEAMTKNLVSASDRFVASG